MSPDESDAYQKNIMPPALCACEYFTRFPGFIIGFMSHRWTRVAVGRVLSAKRPSRSLEDPFYNHWMVNRGTRRAEADRGYVFRLTIAPIFVPSEKDEGKQREKRRRLPHIKSWRWLFVVHEISVDKPTSSFLFFSSPVIPFDETLRSISYTLPSNKGAFDGGFFDRRATRPSPKRTRGLSDSSSAEERSQDSLS